MKISQVEQGQSQVLLNIELEPPELEEHLDGVYRRIVQRINIPGFRKGKAPREVVERYMGRDALLDEALDSLLSSVTSRAIQERSLEVVATPRVKLAQREPLTIEATVAVRPPVELGEYLQIRMDGEKVEITQEEVDRFLETLRGEMGTWEPVERPVEPGDLITMDVRGLVGEETVIDEEGVEYILSLDSSNPLPGFGEKLVGAGRGERREFALSFPEGYSQVEMVGKECQFTVAVEEVKERKLPETDDEFAGSLNMGVKTLAELRSKLEENLRAQSQRAADSRFEEQVVQTLTGRVQVELPPILVEDEVGHILSEQAEALGRQQVSMEEYLSNVGKSVEQLQEEVRPIAVERLTRGLVMQEVARREGISVSPEDVEKELDSIGEESDSGEGSLRRLLSSEEGRKSVGRMLLTRRTLERLTSIARGEAVAAVSSSGETSAQEGQGEPEGGS